MLAGMRSRFLLSFLSLSAFSVAACLPLQAQINGVPPSVTSIGFGGRFINGVRPSVTSLGPNGYGYGNDWFVFGNCCSNFLLPPNPNPPLSSGRQHHRKNHGHADFAVGIIEPAYIPYPAPDAQADDESTDVDYVHAPGPPNQDAPTKRARYRDPAQAADASAKPTPDEPAEAVTVQPPTVLIFKDGHQSDVLNYAIVGDTLFDFAAGRTRKILLADLDLPATHKANDDRGVDFQMPVRTARQ